jgi:hypothetical protein
VHQAKVFVYIDNSLEQNIKLMDNIFLKGLFPRFLFSLIPPDLVLGNLAALLDEPGDVLLASCYLFSCHIIPPDG